MTALPVKYVWILLVPLLSIIFIIYGSSIYFIYKKINQPYIRILLIPAVWILLEFIRSQSRLAFTIGILGYSQYNFLPLMQITKFTGIYGVTFIIVLFNVTIFETILFFIKHKKAVFKYLIISLTLLVIFAIWGILSVNNNLHRAIKEKDYNEVKVAVVQPNVLFGDKYSEKGIEIIPEPYSESSYFKKGTELAVFPESVLWGGMDKNRVFKKWLEEVIRKEDIYLLIGQYVYNEGQTEYYNSAFLYNPSIEITGRYNEIHPVPFSQYVPYQKVLGFLKFLDFSVVNLIPSDEYEPINYPGKGRLGVNICYESTIPSIARKIRNNGAEAIFVLSDNSSLDKSIAPLHHLIFSRVRAIENGCYTVHCANTGISAIISPAGEVINKLDLLEKGVLYESIFLIKEKTFYSKYGNIIMFIYFCSVFPAAACYLILKKNKNKKNS